MQWINDADPAPGGSPITEEEVNRDRTVYLVSDEVADSPRTLKRFYEWFEVECHSMMIDTLCRPIIDDEMSE